MGKLEIAMNKSLRLNNVLIYTLDLENEESTVDIIIEQMDNYILSKGARAIGPLIQYNEMINDNEEESKFVVKFMRQCNNFIVSVDEPYLMKSMIKVNKCLYCRFIGDEDKIKYAYDKIGVVAFEEEINLVGNVYTIFVDKNETEDTITADIFMEREA